MSALHFWVSDRGTRAYPYPGRSTKWSFCSTRKKLTSCVQPGVWLVLASPGFPTSRFNRLDLPTLLLPRKATSPKKSPPSCCSGGNCSGRAAERRNSAFKYHYAPEPADLPSGQIVSVKTLNTTIVSLVQIPPNVLQIHCFAAPLFC